MEKILLCLLIPVQLRLSVIDRERFCLTLKILDTSKQHIIKILQIILQYSELKYAVDGILTPTHPVKTSISIVGYQFPWLVVELDSPYRIKVIRVNSRADHLYDNRFLNVSVSRDK